MDDQTIEKISDTEIKVTVTPAPIETVYSIDALNAEKDDLLRQIDDLNNQRDFEVKPRQTRLDEIDSFLASIATLPITS